MSDHSEASVSILAALHLSHSVISSLRSVKDAPKECQRLLLDVCYINGVLDILNETIQAGNNAADWAATTKVLANDNGPIDHFRRILEPLKAKLDQDVSVKRYKRFTKSLLWPLTTEETLELARAIEKQMPLLFVALDNDHRLLAAAIRKDASAIRHSLGQEEESVKSVATIVTILDHNQQDEKVSEALQWLSPLQYQQTQNDTYRQRHAGSLNWFLQSPEFQSWISEDSKVLFCPGIPGSGKTVLAATVINYLQEQFPNEVQDVAIAGIYCSFKARATQTTTNLLGSICAQLTWRRKDLMETLVDMHNNQKRPKAAASHGDVIKLLQECLGKYRKIYVVVDALDENIEDHAGRIPILDEIRGLLSHLHILVTSRPIPSIESEFLEATRVDIVAQEADIRSYIRVGLEWPQFKGHTGPDDKLRTYIEENLVERSQDMFLLPKLHMNALRKMAKYGKTALHNAVSKFPGQLDQTYYDILKRINSQVDHHALLAAQVFSWIHLSRSSLTTRALQQALAEQRGDDLNDDSCLIDSELLVSVCSGLVVINEESQYIQLIHHTVEEYFDRYFDEFYPNAERDINYPCLHHSLSQLENLRYEASLTCPDQWWWYELQEQRDAEEEKRQLHDPQVPFSNYALCHIEMFSSSTETVRGIDTGILQAYQILFWSGGRLKEDYTQDLRFAVFFKYHEEVRRILNSSEVETPRDVKSCCLAYAALQGSDEIVSLLLDTNADVEKLYSMQSERIGSTSSLDANCLGCAIWERRVSTVKLILSRHPELIDSPVQTRRRTEEGTVAGTGLGLVVDLKRIKQRPDSKLDAIECIFHELGATKLSCD